MKEELYREIAVQHREEYGGNVTAKQVKNRWEALKRKYEKIKAQVSCSGGSSTTWEYFEDMEAVLDEAPCVAPVATASSSQGLVCRKRKVTAPLPDLSGDSDVEETGETVPQRVSVSSKEKQRVRGPTAQSRCVSILADFLSKAEEDRQARREEREQRHLQVQAATVAAERQVRAMEALATSLSESIRYMADKLSSK